MTKRKAMCSQTKLCQGACSTCHARSITATPLLRLWSNRNQEDPTQVFAGSSTKYWFKCDECAHDFEARPADMQRKPKYCPFCHGKSLCLDQTCAQCYQRSFASHPKAQFWDAQRNIASPRYMLKGSGQKCFFRCARCDHPFQSALSSILRGRWCPYCTRKKFCDDDSCLICLEKSLASSTLKYYWHPSKNAISPRYVAMKSAERYWFQCPKCDFQFERKPSRNHANLLEWCPACSATRNFDSQAKPRGNCRCTLSWPPGSDYR